MDSSLRQYFIKHGVILGFLQVITYYLLYFIDRTFLASFSVGLILLLLIIVYPIVAAVKYRKQNEGYIELKEGFQLIFMISVLRGLIATVFTLLLFFVIDTDLAAFIQKAIQDNTMKMMQNFGAPEDKIQEAMDRMQSAESQFSLMNQLKGFLYGLVISAFFALVIAAIIKRKRPVFENTIPDSTTSN